MLASPKYESLGASVLGLGRLFGPRLLRAFLDLHVSLAQQHYSESLAVAKARLTNNMRPNVASHLW